MIEKKQFAFIIDKPENIKAAIDLMTRRRAFIWLCCGEEDSHKSKFSIELKKPDDENTYYLYIGKKILSRDLVNASDFDADETFRNAAAGMQKLDISFKSLEIPEGSELTVNVGAPNEFCANAMFIGRILQFFNPPMKWYMDTLFADVSVYLKEDSDGCEEVKNTVEFTDLKRLNLYGELKEIFFTPNIYEDDIFLEYYTEDGGIKAYYFLNEWYSNHMWGADPAILTLWRVCAGIGGFASKDEILSENSFKYARDATSGKSYYLDTIQTVSKNYFGGQLHRKYTNHSSLTEFKDWKEDRDEDIWRA